MQKGANVATGTAMNAIPGGDVLSGMVAYLVGKYAKHKTDKEIFKYVHKYLDTEIADFLIDKPDMLISVILTGMVTPGVIPEPAMGVSGIPQNSEFCEKT